MKYILPFLVVLLLAGETFSQSVNDLLNVLIEQKIISQSIADSLREGMGSAGSRIDICNIAAF